MSIPHWTGRRVLVTGGAGVIGRELLLSLDDAGTEILCCDLKARPVWLPQAVEYFEGDVIDLEAQRIGSFAPDTCVHLAATFERTEESPSFWHENYHHNVAVSHHLIAELAKLRSVERLVFASSYLTYDPALYLFDEPPADPAILSESSPIRPRNLCGAAKLMHEEELRFLNEHEAVSFSSVSARIFRVFGRGSNDVVSRWIRTLIGGQTEIEVFRTEGAFDYVFAADVAEGLLRLAASNATGSVNLGSGQSRRVSDVVDILGSHFPELEQKNVTSEIPYEAHAANLDRLVAVTGWSPQTSLESGIAKLVDYERSIAGQASEVGADSVTQ